MLSRLKINNFQKHSDLEVKFDEKITAIVGESDVGKSSILRAIKWIAFNRPRGDGFIKDGEKEVSVKLKMDKSVLERKRGKENLYIVDKQRLVAFGNDVPPQVDGIMNLGEENFAFQHDPPFFFCETAGEVARRLNKIADLDIIDTVSANIASKMRKTKATKEVVEERLKTVIEEVESLQYVDQLEKDLSVLEIAEEENQARSTRMACLSDLMNEAILSHKKASRLLKAHLSASGLAKRGTEAIEVRESLISIQDLVESVQIEEQRMKVQVPNLGGLSQLVEDVGEQSYRLDHLSSLVKLVKIEDKKKQKKIPDIRKLSRLVENIQKNKKLLKNLENFVNSGVKLTDNRVEKELVLAEERLEKEMGGLCPLCGSEI